MVSASFANEQYRSQEGKATRKRNSYQKVIICPSEPRRLIFDYCGAISALPGALSLVTAVRFLNGQKTFLLTTAAQNIHVLFRKSPLLKEHFFELLKTAISSTACGMSTLKSLLPQAFAVSNVHPRPRKRLARCTLDCGFKTPESPALRGFEAERCPITGTSLYLVLKSNGLHRPKIRLKKFSFSLKIVPAYISKKLPSQCWPKPLFIAFFNFSHKWPTFAFVHESGYTLAFAQRIAHSGSQGETGAVSDGALLLPSERSARSQTSPGRVSERRTLPLLGLGRRHS